MKKSLMGLAAALLVASCTQVGGWFGNNADSTTTTLKTGGAYKAKLFRDLSITRENAYSNIFIDSAVLENYLLKENITGDAASRIRDFYLVRNNGAAWFSSEGITEQARSLWGLYANEPQKKNEPAYAIKGRMDSLLTNDSLFLQAVDSAIKIDPSQTGLAEAMEAKDSIIIQTELTLTAQLVRLSETGNGVVTAENFCWLVPRKKMDAMQLADSLLNKQADSSLWTNNRQYSALKNNLRSYYKAAKQGGWQPVPAISGLQKGLKSPAVTQLKKRMSATADYPASDTSAIVTDSLLAGIRRIQEQYGFAPTGTLTDSLVAELNVPAKERVQQILVNMNRALWTKPVGDSAHIAVNIPSLELMAFSDSGMIIKMPVIVGEEGSGTMAFNGKVSSVVFSPYWNIPQSIVQNELKPAIKNDPAYLKKKNMEIVKQDGEFLEIRQRPGGDNALGQVKFLFPNSFDIYLHDTPNKDLFAQQNRALSHGCIRVASPDLLAQFILKGQAEWTPEKITAAMNSGKEQTAEVSKPMPVAITYYTAFIDEKGRINFRKDLYSYDKKTAAKMFAGAI